MDGHYLKIVISAKAGIQEYTGCRIKPACCRQVRHDGVSLFNCRVNILPLKAVFCKRDRKPLDVVAIFSALANDFKCQD